MLGLNLPTLCIHLCCTWLHLFASCLICVCAAPAALLHPVTPQSFVSTLKVLQYLPNIQRSLCAHPVPSLSCSKVPWGVTDPGTTSGTALALVEHRMSVKECV